MLFASSFSSLSYSELGAIGVLCLLLAGALRLIKYMVQKKWEEGDKTPCKLLEQGVCPLAPEFEKYNKMLMELHDVHCGNRAIGQDGVPRWYFGENVTQQVADIHAMLTLFRVTMKQYLELREGKSERISKDAMRMFHQVCLLIDEVKNKSMSFPTSEIPIPKDLDMGELE